MTQSTKPTIGFIGLGTLGQPMATNLLKAGYRMNVHDLNPVPVAEMTGQGAAAPGLPAEAARASDVVITVVPDAPDVELDCLGDTFTYCGPLGNGVAMKLVNNYISASIIAVHAEALSFGIKAGLTLENIMRKDVRLGLTLAREMGVETPVGRGVYETLEQTCAAGHATNDLTSMLRLHIDLAHKDLGLALNWANRTGLPVPMAALIRERYNQARAQGWGAQDCTAIVNLCKDLGRLE